MNLLVETSMLMLIYLIMQQKHLKNATGIGTSKLAAKADLASLKAKVEKLDIDKLLDKLLVPVDLSKLSDAVKCKSYWY